MRHHALLSLFVLAAPLAAQQRPITFDDFITARAVSDPHVAPDGLWVL